MKDNMLNISISLAGRSYPVVVREDEESFVQTIVQDLEAEISDMSTRYANKLNKQDILAMLLLTYAKKYHEEQQKNDLSPIENRVDSIIELLELTSDPSEK